MTRWYDPGLRFGCTQCGHCCTGEPGHVWVGEAEEARIARALRLPLDTFRARYVRQVGDRRSLLERPNGDCILLSPDRKCLVHDAKPRQCVTFPFWPSVLLSEERWRQRSAECPGMNQGPLFRTEEIEALADPRTPRERCLEIVRKPRS